MQAFTGKVAVVTGAASGIGSQVVSGLVSEGARVIVLDLAEVPHGDEIHAVSLDVSDEQAWQSLEAHQPAGWEAPQIFVNCAGVLVTGDIETLDYASFQRILAINTGGTFLGCRHAVRTLRRSGMPGAIVNVVSTSALRTAPWVAGYAASKAAALSLTRSVALHCAQARLPIRCNAVLPGITETPMVREMIDAAPEAERAAVRATLEAQHPTGRLLDAAEVASSVLYLASDEASGITGAALSVDGGLTAA